MIKAQVLADFISKFTTKEDEEVELMVWMIWTKGSSNQWAGGAEVFLRLPEGDTIECVIRLQFSITNNEAEYEAVLSGLDLPKAARAISVVIHYDSQVIVEYINGDYEAKREWMKEYLSMVKGKMSEEFSAKFVQVLREENEQADRLAKVAFMEYMDVTNQVLSFVQYSLAIDKVEVQVILIGADWTTSIVSYFRSGMLPEDRNASRRLKVQSSHFLMIGDVLYKTLQKGFLSSISKVPNPWQSRLCHEGST